MNILCQSLVSLVSLDVYFAVLQFVALPSEISVVQNPVPISVQILCGPNDLVTFKRPSVKCLWSIRTPVNTLVQYMCFYVCKPFTAETLTDSNTHSDRRALQRDHQWEALEPM